MSGDKSLFLLSPSQLAFRKEDSMERSFCRHCVCLAKGKNGEWECDELGKNIKEVETCPEGGE